MRYGQSDERYRSAECRSDSSQNTGGYQEQVSCTFDVHTQILGISVAQKQGIEWLYQEDSKHQSGQCHAGKVRHLFEGYTTEIPHAPNHVRMYSLGRSEEIEQGDGRRGNVPDHHPRNEQHDVALDESREEQDRSHDYHGTDEGSQYDREKSREGNARCSNGSSSQKHDHGHPEAGSRIDSEDRRTGQWIVEGGL